MIERRKIIQVWDKEIDDVLMYSQTLSNKITGEEVELQAIDLSELNIKVDILIREWKSKNTKM